MIKTNVLNKLVKSSAVLAFSVFALSLPGKANSPDNVNSGSSDLTAAATYAGGSPTTTSDVVFTAVPYSPSAFTLNTPGFNLSIGTLNDFSSTALTIQNTTAGSYSTITLNGGTNNAPGGPASNDLLYVATGASLTVGGGSGGTLFLNATGSGNLDIAGSATIAGPLTGTGALVKTGVGTLDLSGSSLYPLISSTTTASIYTGGLTISTGTVELSSATALEGSAVTNSVANGLTFDSAVSSHTFNVGALAGAGNIALADTANNAVNLVLTENSFGLGNTATSTGYTGTLSGAGSLVKEGSATETLTAVNTYTGSTSVNGGTLSVTGSLTSSSLNLGGGTFNFNKTGGTQTFSTTTFNQGSSAITTGAATDTVNLGTVTRNAYSAVDFGTTGTITASGLTNTNGIIGGWATAGGQTTFAVAPASPGGAVTGLATASYTSSATVGTTPSNYNNVNLDILPTGSFTATTGSGSPVVTVSSTAGLAAGQVVNIPNVAAGTTILSVGTGSITLSANATATASGSNSYFGNAAPTGTITPNSIRFNSGNISYLLLATTGTNTVESGGILATSSAATSSVISGGSITSGTSELDVTVNKTVSLSTVVADNGSPVAVVLNGGGTLNLNDTNSYTGGTFVNNGILSTGNVVGAFGTGTITLGANGSSANAYLVGGSETYSNAITVNPGGNRQLYTSSGGAPNYSGTITLVGGADLAIGSNGGGSITISGGVQGTGNLQIGSPEGTNRKVNTYISGGAVNINGTLSDFSGVDTSAVVFVSAPVTGNTAILQDGINQLFVFTGTNTNVGPTTIASGYLQLGGTVTTATTTPPTFGAAGANGSLSASSIIVDNGTFVIDRTGTVTQGTNFSTAGITGTGGLTLYGTGTTVLTAANTYTGATSILTNTANPTAGRLQLGNGGTVGSLSTSSAIVDNGTFAIDRSNTVTEGVDFTAATSFTGTGGLAQIGTGTTVLLGSNGYSGTTLVSAGALQLGNGTTNGALTATGTVTDNSTLIIDESGSVLQSAVVPGVIGGTGAVVQEGTGTLTLTASNTFSGGLTIDTAVSTGTLSDVGTGTVTFSGSTAANGILNYTGSAGALANALTVNTGDYGTINNSGSGTLTLSGPISKNGSVLTLEGFNGGNFLVTGTITGASAGSDLDVLGSTVVTLAAANTYNGPTSINGSPLSLGAEDVLVTSVSNALPSSSVVSLGNSDGGNGYINILDLDGTSQTIAGLSSSNDTTSPNDTNLVVNSTGTLSGANYNVNNGSSGSLTINTTGNYTYGGTLGNGTGGNNFSVTVSGTGTQTFSGANTYTGGTTVNGNLYLMNGTNGSATGNGALVVNAGGTLGGIGSSSGTSFAITGTSTSSRATVLVGQSSPTDTNITGAMSLTATTGTISYANLVFNLSASGNGASNQLSVGTTQIGFGTQVQSTVLTLNLQGTGVIPINTPYVLIAGTGSTGNLGTGGVTTGQYAGLTTFVNAQGLDEIAGSNNGGNGNLVLSLGGLGGVAQSWYGPGSYLYINDTGGVDDIDVEVVPEPGTWSMLIGGLITLLVWQRRRRA